MQKHFVTDYSICSNDLYLVYHLFSDSFIRLDIVYLFNGSMFLFHSSIHPSIQPAILLWLSCVHYARTCNGNNASHSFVFFLFLANPDRAPPEYTQLLARHRLVCVCACVFGSSDDRGKWLCGFLCERTRACAVYVCTCDTRAQQELEITIKSKWKESNERTNEGRNTAGAVIPEITLFQCVTLYLYLYVMCVWGVFL